MEPIQKITLLANPNRQPQGVTVLQKPTNEPNKPKMIPGTDIPRTKQEEQTEYFENPDEIDYLLVTALADPGHRFFILKLDRELEHFMSDFHINLLQFPPMSTFQRLILHHVANYFKLGHNVVSTANPNGSRKPVILNKTAESRIPVLRLHDFIAKEENAPKKIKILARAPPKATPTLNTSTANKTTLLTNQSNHSAPQIASIPNPQRAVAQTKKRAKVVISDRPTVQSPEPEIGEDSKVLTQREVDYAKARARIFNEPFDESEYTIIPEANEINTAIDKATTTTTNLEINDLPDLTSPSEIFKPPTKDSANVQIENPVPMARQAQTVPQTRSSSEPRLPHGYNQNQNNVFVPSGGFSPNQYQTGPWMPPMNTTNTHMSRTNLPQGRVSPDPYQRTWGPSPPPGSYSPMGMGPNHQAGMIPINFTGHPQILPQSHPYPPQYQYPSVSVPQQFQTALGMEQQFQNMNMNPNHTRNPYAAPVVGRPILYDFSETIPGSAVEPVKTVPPHILELLEVNLKMPQNDPGIEEIRKVGASIKKLGPQGPFIAVFRSNNSATEALTNIKSKNFRLSCWSGKLK